MKYAIVEISGRQFWIEKGKYYDFNRIPTELGKQISLNRVLLLNNDGNVLIGKPYLENVQIKGEILWGKYFGPAVAKQKYCQESSLQKSMPVEKRYKMRGIVSNPFPMPLP